MSPAPEEMISWVLAELTLAGAEGVSISSLFDGINARLWSTSQPSTDESTKESLWKSLVAREDIGFGDETKGAILRTLAYQHVLALDFGDRKIKLRNPTPPPALNGNLVRQPIQPSQPSSPALAPAQGVPSLHNPLASTIEEHTSPPTTRASLDTTEATSHSVAGSLQHTASRTSKPKGRRARASNPKPVERKTDRTWIPKIRHATQEEADRHQDVLEYEAGISRVYINPPGSARPEPPDRSESPEEQEQGEQAEHPRKKKAAPPKQLIAVFKSLNLMDPQWLRNRMGTWRPACIARKAELAASVSVEPSPALQSTSKKGRPKTNRAAETPTPAPDPSSSQVEVQANETTETTSLSESTLKKHKAGNISDADQGNGDGEPLKKRAYRRKSTTLTNVSLPSEIAQPTPHAANATPNSHGADQSPFQSQTRPMSLDGQQTSSTLPPTVCSQQDSLQPQFSPQSAWNYRAGQQYHQHVQNDPHYHDVQYARPSSMAPSAYGLLYEPRPQPFHAQPPPPIYFRQEITNQSATPQPAIPQPEIPQSEVPPPPSVQLARPQPDTPQSVVKSAVVKHRVNKAHIDAAEATWSQKRCDELRAECLYHDLAVRGLKSELVARLSEALFELEESESAATVQPPSMPHPVSQQWGLQPAITEPTLQQPTLQQPVTTPRPNLLSRLMQNTPKAYQSPYAISDNIADKSAPTPPPGTGPLQQAQQGMYYQHQPQGPPLGYFSSSSSRPRFPTSIRPLGSTPAPSRTTQPIESPTPSFSAGRGVDNQTIAQKPYKSTLLAEIEAMEETLERFSPEAAAIVLPDITTRLFVSYDNVVGNLVLSKDKTELTFVTLDQEPSEPPLLTLQASQIRENPNVSMKKSRPMELRVKYEDKNEEEVLCRFYFGQTEAAYQAANEMRAAIVRARIVCRAAAGQTDTYKLFREDAVANIEIVKPWECETCKKRFKNKEGLKYHQSKSSTTCNPNFDPSTKPRKPEKIRKPKKDSLKPGVKAAPGTTRTAKRVKKVDFDDQESHVGKGDLLRSVEYDDSCDSGSSSDDSILLWAEKVAFANPGMTIKSTPPTPRKQAPKKSTLKLPTEQKLLFEMLEEVMNSTAADETVDTAVEAVLRDVVEEVVTFTTLRERISVAAAVSGGQDSEEELSGAALLEQVNYQRSRDIILDLVKENFGIFPGDRAIWFAFVGVWLQNNSRSNVLPLSRLCDEALNQLVQDKRLVVTVLPASENDPMALTCTIVTLPAVELDSPVVEKLRELIQMAYPRSYVPSKFAPPTAVLERLQIFSRGSLASDESKASRKRQDYSKLAAVPHGGSDYEYAAEDDYSLHSEDIIEDFEDDEGDSDDEYYEGGPRRPKHDGSVARKRQGQRRKDYWAVSKAMGSNVITKTGNQESIDLDSSVDSRSISRSPGDEFLDGNSIRRTKSGSPPSRSRFGRPKARPRAWKGGPIPPEEKERRRNLQANRLLNFAPTLLPNAETGAWDQAPLHVKPAPKRRTRVLRCQLPEVITYLQSENGAWESRAYGHGSPPIHSRPARRADGNPGLQAYLKRISQGHRPILWPAENATRVFLPGPPSKFLLRAGLPGRSRKRSEGHISDVAASEDENFQPQPTKRSAKRKLGVTAAEGDETQHSPKRRRTQVPESGSQPPLPDTIDEPLPANATLQSPSKITLRVTRKAKRGGQELDEIQKLDFLKPRAFFDFQKSPNPGLVSLPIRFWVTNSNDLGSARRSPSVSGLNSTPKASAPVAHTPTPGLKGFEKVAAWEQGPAREMLTSGAKAVGLGWINHTVDAMESAFDTETMKLKWDETATFKIEDLPYGNLDDSDDVEPVEEATQTKSQDAQPAKKRQRTKEKKKEKVLRRRRLTAWPSDFDGVVDNIDEVRDELEVELAPRMALFNRALDGTMSNQEEARLLVAVIVVMTLTGGVDKSIDWALVCGLFPEYAAHHLRKTWARMFKNQKALIDILAPKFQDTFLAAYEAGEVPKIDYDHLVDYDWGKVVDWAMKKIYSKGHSKDILLPGSRKEFKRLYDFKEKDNGVDKARESYFNPSSAAYKRMEVVTAIAHTLPAHAQPSPKSADDIEIDEFTLARSWIRALVFTPEEDYDKEVAHEKLLDLGDDLVEEVKQALVEDKVIRHQNNGRAAPGRVFEPTEVFYTALRHHVTERHFVQAVAFKKFLDDEFASGNEFVRSDYMANEGTLMCVTNLQAYGRIVLKAASVPMKPFGLTDGGYETSKIPKERFRFNMDIYPTSSYLFDEEIPELQEYVEPPRGGEAGEIPLWYGITEDLIPDIWKKVLVAVAGTTALRAGASVASLQSTFKPALEGWEIWRLMEWGVNVGLMKRVDEAHEGWTMGEWWWAIVGRFCNDE